jgi:hypothetical protein
VAVARKRGEKIPVGQSPVMAIRRVAVAPAARRAIVPTPTTRATIAPAPRPAIAPINLGRGRSARRSTNDNNCDRKRTRPKRTRFSYAEAEEAKLPRLGFLASHPASFPLYWQIASILEPLDKLCED